MDKEKIKYIPEMPGVYLMKDRKGTILYVGKAASLKKRVSSYFQPSSGHSERIRLMVERIADVGFMVTGSEAEALITESAFIKRYKPRYNVALKDDKSYPHVKLTVNEDYPRIMLTRKLQKDGALYYGPYTDVKLLRKALRIMQKIFPLRSCRRLPKKVCLDYHIGRCYGPCAEAIDKKAYGNVVKELRLFLEGKRKILIEELSKKMRKAAEKRDYENAALLRDRITALSVVPATRPGTGRQRAFISTRKQAGPYDEIVALKFLLSLKRVPRRIEVFDVSNTGPSEAVGSMVTFLDGRPSKDDYRRFKIRRVKGIDDYKMMKEIVGRRYEAVKKRRSRCPDLIIIDGGKGHLNAVLATLKDLGFERLTVIGIAKRFEHIYKKDRKEPIIFSRHSSVLHLVQRLRDEAHRFAITYHRHLRGKKLKMSALDGIEGIGPKRKRLLLGIFGSVENIKKASLEDLISIKGIDKTTATRIKDVL